MDVRLAIAGSRGSFSKIIRWMVDADLNVSGAGVLAEQAA
jgi:hypothetical protein